MQTQTAPLTPRHVPHTSLSDLRALSFFRLLIVFTDVAFGGEAPFAFTFHVGDGEVVHDLSIAEHRHTYSPIASSRPSGIASRLLTSHMITSPVQ